MTKIPRPKIGDVIFKVVNKHRGSCIIDPKSQLVLKYAIGDIVRAHPKSAGVLCFRTYTRAENFSSNSHNSWSSKSHFIIEVQILGLKRAWNRPNLIHYKDLKFNSVQNILQKLRNLGRPTHLHGVVACTAVKVLT